MKYMQEVSRYLGVMMPAVVKVNKLQKPALGKVGRETLVPHRLTISL